MTQLRDREIPRVVGRSITRTKASTVSFVSKDLRKKINLKKSDIDQSITSRRCEEKRTITHWWFEVAVKGKPLPLKDYAARKTQVSGSRNWASFKVSKGWRRKRYVAKGQKGFISDRLGGHVFVRDGVDPPGPQKAPLRKVFGPAIPHFFQSNKFEKGAHAHALATFEKELLANAKNAIRKRSL